MTNKLTVQDLIDLLTDESQITVEQRALPVLINNGAASVTDFMEVRLDDVGFNASGYCVMKSRAKNPSSLKGITTVLCLCTHRFAKPAQADPGTDLQVDT